MPDFGIGEAIAAIAAAAAEASVTEIATTVALVGVGTSVVGMATGNKLVSQIGMGLAAAGTIAGLGAGLIGGEAVAATAGPAESTAAATQASEGIQAATADPITALAPDVSAPINASASAAPATVDATAPITQTANAGTIGGEAVGAAPDVANAATVPGTPPPSPAPDLAAGPAAPGAPVTPAVDASAATNTPNLASATQAPTVNPVTSDASGMIAQAGQPGAGTVLRPEAMVQGMNTDPGGVAGWWSKLDPSMKATIALAAGQTGAGMAGGLFQGMSAQQRLDLEKLINSQYQNQVQYRNRNNQYAPSLKFNSVTGPAGMIPSAQGGTA